MKLLFITATDRLKGGGEISNYELIVGAKKRGHEVRVILPARGKLASKLAAAGIKSTVVKYYWWALGHHPQRTADDLSAINDIRKLIIKFDSQIVITNSFNVPWGALAAAAANRPHVWLAREMPLYQYSYLADRYDFFTAYGNLVLANSKTNADFIRGQVGHDFPVDFFYPYVDITGHQLSKTSGPPRIVNVGTIQPGKNQLELIKAAAILNKKGQLKHRLLLIGDQRNPDYARQVISTIDQQGLNGKVRLLKFKEYPYEALRQNDIFIQTSVYESFGRTTVEAMKLGLVCIGADIPATRELFKVGGGVLYEPGKPSDLARQIQAVLKEPKQYQELAQAAQRRALNSLSEAACHDKFFEAILPLAGQTSKRPEIVHLLPYMQAAAGLSRDTWKEFDSILNSKTWRAANILRKVIYGWRKWLPKRR